MFICFYYFYRFTHFPYSLQDTAISISEFSNAILGSFEPFTGIYFSCSPLKYALTVFDIFQEVTFEDIAIFVLKFSVSMDLVLIPLAVIYSAIEPVHLSLAVYHAILPITFKDATTVKFAFTITISLSFLELSYIYLIVEILLTTISVLEIVFPLALVSLTTLNLEKVCCLLRVDVGQFEFVARVLVMIYTIAFSLSLFIKVTYVNSSIFEYFTFINSFQS